MNIEENKAWKQWEKRERERERERNQRVKRKDRWEREYVHDW